MTRLLINRRKLLAASGGVAAAAILGRPAAAQTVLRWATVLGATHPEVQMIQRVIAQVKEKTSGRIDIQGFPGGQLGSPSETVEMTAAGAIGFVSEGAAALGQFASNLSIIEAPYVWRDSAHMAKTLASPIVGEFNKILVERRGLRIVGATYYGRRHLTTGNKPINSVADMAGFKLRVPPVDVFRAMAEAWGARPTPINFNELYLALSQGAVDGQENPLPTIQSAKLNEVQKFLVLTSHIITPRLIVASDRMWNGLAAGDREIVQAALREGIEWHDKELRSQEQSLVGQFRAAGMTVIEPDLESFRKPVLADLPKRFEEKWGKGMWDRLQNM
ncbi:MAG: sialic acid TRAP transporter substrate-binding protein SiaP [Rhabdaerophilum sp.]